MFLLFIFIIICACLYIRGKKLDKKYKYSEILLPIILLSLIINMCLGVTYLGAAIPGFYDGIGMDNKISYWIIGEGLWSTSLFRDYFYRSINQSIILTGSYCILKIVKKQSNVNVKRLPLNINIFI